MNKSYFGEDLKSVVFFNGAGFILSPVQYRRNTGLSGLFFTAAALIKDFPQSANALQHLSGNYMDCLMALSADLLLLHYHLHDFFFFICCFSFS